MDRIEAPLVDRIFTRLVFSCDTKSVANFVSQFGPKKFGPEFGPLVICFGHAAPKISVQNSEGQSAHTACVQIHGSGPVCDSSEPKPCNPEFQHKNIFDLWDLGSPEIKSKLPKGPGLRPPAFETCSRGPIMCQRYKQFGKHIFEIIIPFSYTNVIAPKLGRVQIWGRMPTEDFRLVGWVLVVVSFGLRASCLTLPARFWGLCSLKGSSVAILAQTAHRTC